MLGFNVRALVVFLAVWVIVLFVQTAFVLDEADVPPEAWECVPVQLVIMALGVTHLRVTAPEGLLRGQPVAR
jgi:hypothetical protein